MNFIDDHSCLAVATRVLRRATAPAVLRVFQVAGARRGLPAGLLTDNGCVYTTWHRGGPNVMQTELLAASIDYRHSRPYHPQTCGKVERFHQTMKAFLPKQPKASSVRELQAQIDRFVAYYNEVRPHRSTGRRPPKAAFDARDKARPSGPRIRVGVGVRLRRDRIYKGGKVTLRHRTRLHHIGVGHAHKGKRVILVVNRLDVRIISEDGELLRRLTLDRVSTTSHRRRESRLRCADTPVHDGLTHHTVEVKGFEPLSPGDRLGLLRAQPMIGSRPLASIGRGPRDQTGCGVPRRPPVRTGGVSLLR